MALDPWPITLEATKPNPARIAAISLFYDGCYPLHYTALQFSYALFITTTRRAALGPRCRCQTPRTATTLGLFFISARTGND